MRQHDLRDLYRRGSGMTLRRVFVLAKALPREGQFWSEVRESLEAAKVSTPEQIRDRAEHYRRQRRRK